MDDNGNPSGSDHDLQLSVAQAGAADLQLGSMNSNSTLEILVDGSELLNEGLGNEGLELSISFEKTHETQGEQSELADCLDGVEVRVSLDGTQAVGVEVVSSRDSNEEIVQPGDLQLGLEGPERSSLIFRTETDTDTLPLPSPGNMEDVHVTGVCPSTFSALSTGNDAVESDNFMGNGEQGDANHSSEKKRSREEGEEEVRCLKLKSTEVKDQGLEDCLRPVAEQVEHVKPESDNVLGFGPQDMEHSKLKAELETTENNGEITSASTRTIIAGQSAVENGTVNEGKETCGGEGLNNERCNNGSTEVDSLHSRDDNKESKVGEGGRKRHQKRRKIAMLLAYCGAGYQGMQKNPGAVTIEGLLEDALSKAGAMPDNYDGNPRKVDWMRAARTDKGVSAVGQVVSGLFYIDPPGFVERVNTHLPEQIRLLGYKRVTPTFSAKKFCDRRRYEYVIPIFALDPSTHRDREAVIASEGKEDAFVKCLECSERGRKIPASKVFHRPSPDKGETNTDDGQIAASELPSRTIESGISNGTSCAVEQPHQDAISVEVEPLPVLKVAGLSSVEEEEVKQGPLAAVPDPRKEPFHFGDAERAKLNRILSYYVGTHNFHNFTSRVKAEDPSAKRYMVSFEAGDVFTVGNTELVRCTVVGQSFMLHQIRKMIGLAIAVFRGFTPESIFETALRRDRNITIPTAPELGLFLDECMYPAYNQKWYDTHEEVSQKGHEQEISRFKHEVIYEHIAATEHKDGQMALFLHSLNDRNYEDLASAREAAEAKLESS